jgi:hypothetical protein
MTALLNGIPFAVNPTSLSWNYQVKLSRQPTIGGTVIQLYGWSMSDLVIEGSFGKNGIERQQAFMQLIESIVDDQTPVVTSTGARAAKPVRFLWPEQNWDFWVFIRALSQVGASVAIESTAQMTNPRYSLTMFVYEDNGTVVKAATESAMLAYMNRLSAGLGWQQSKWNGPQNDADLTEVLKGKSFIDYAFTAYGLPNLNAQVATPGAPLTGPQ